MIAILRALLAVLALLAPELRVALKDYTELHAAQWEAFHAPERHKFILGGRGSGKDHYAIAYTLDAIGQAGPGFEAFYIGPSHRQVKKIAWKRFKAAIPKHLILGRPNETELLFNFRHGPTLQLVGSDNTDSLRGPDINLAVVTEFEFCKDDLLAALEGGLRTQEDRIVLISSPNGPGHGLDDWIAVASDPEWARFRGPTGVNPFHDAKGLEFKRRRLARNVFNQEYGAEHVTLTGAVYADFSLLRNVRPFELDPRRLVLLGQDFNAGYIATVIGQVNRAEVKRGVYDDALCITHEFVSHSTIEHHAVALRDFLRSLGVNHEAGAELWSDASGDFQAVGDRAAPRESADNKVMKKYGFRVRHPPQNPKVIERILAKQSLILSGTGEVRFFVHPTRCREYINCLQRQLFNQWGKPDKNGGLDHLNDAGGYLAHAKFPVRGRGGWARSA